MQPAEIDVVGIGNAIVDIIAHGDDNFLSDHGMQKCGMALIDEAKAEALYAAMGRRCSFRVVPRRTRLLDWPLSEPGPAISAR